MKMKVRIVSRKLIKPCTPTPPNLKRYKLSFIDELIPPMNMSLILFYPKSNPTTDPPDSLARILPQFYPLAGRYIKNDLMVDCNDEGAEFFEAEVADLDLTTFLSETPNEELDALLPRQTYDVDNPDDPILSVQITNFPKCGGRAVGVSLSHRISDASSLGTFVAAWACATRHPSSAQIVIPSFSAPSIFPGADRSIDFEPPRRVVVRRLLFGRETVSQLRSESGGVPAASRVRIVSAFIAKGLIRVELAKNGRSRACHIGQGVNMRTRMIPPMPRQACGNYVMEAVATCIAADETREPRLDELVLAIGSSIERAVADCGKILSLDREGRNETLRGPLAKMFEMLGSEDNIALWFTDWSKFGMYEADFGWGKPAWIRVGTIGTENLTVLMEDKEGGGIEAWVNLSPQDVAYFERDDGLKSFLVA